MRHIRPLLTVLVAGALIPAFVQLTTAGAAVAHPAFRCIDCNPSPSPPPPPPPPPSDPPAPQCSPGFISNSNPNDNWEETGVTGVNDVAAGADGSVWYITGTPGTAGSTVRLGGGTVTLNGAPKGGKRIAVDPQGHPWIVDFNGNIFRDVGGSFQLMPGLARDIGIGGNGAVWVIGTNSQNGSFEAWSWNGSSWVADPGSGEEIDVAANGDPVVNGSDGKTWIKNGGADQGWSQVDTGGLSVFDMGLSPCFAPGQTVGGSAMWFVNTHLNPSGVFSISVGGLQGPYTTFNSGPFVAQDTNQFGQVTASHAAVDTVGHAFVVADPGGCDCPGDLLERPLN